MTLHRLHLPTRKAGRNNRSMLEHLLRIEEEAVKKAPEIFFSDEKKKRQKEIFQQYTTKHQLTTLTYEAIQEYLLITAEKENEFNVGEYTSMLVEQIEGDTPLVIDLQGKTLDYLLHGIHTPRHITIQNVEGNDIGSFAGNHHGTANIHFKNINGNYTGCNMGSNHGNAIARFQNINGDHTGYGIGSYNGNAIAIFQNINGDHTGAGIGGLNGHATAIFENINGHCMGFQAGTDGNSTIIAYNSTGYKSFIEQKGILVLVNPNEIPRIEGIYDSETRRQIQTLIAQNATPQEILEYIEANK